MIELLSGFGLGLIIPTTILALLGWFVPKWLGGRYADSLPKVIAVGLVSTFVMYLLAGALFAALYVAQGAPLSALGELGVSYFLVLGRGAALIWAPIMLLSLIGLDPRYRSETW